MRKRTIKVKVAEVLDGTKADFYADLLESTRLACSAANKSMSTCFGSDAGLMTGGKCPKLYTYPVVAAEFPGVANIAAGICRRAEKMYLAKRWEIYRGKSSVPSFRSFPWILLHNKSGKTIHIEDKTEFIQCRIKLLSRWWTVRLAGGTNWRTQINGLRSAMQHGKICDSQIWIDKSNKAIIGVSVELDGVNQENNSSVMNIVSGIESPIVATKERSTVPFVITGDDVNKWVSERNRTYQRLRQDRKSGTSRKKINKLIAVASRKWNNRMDSWTHETSAKLVAHARRKKCGIVSVDFTVKSFAKQFPWFELTERIKYKCEDAGIRFVCKTQSVTDPDVSRPHIYFKYSPATHRIKIGKTSRSDGGRHGSETDAPEQLVILAVDNQPKSKLTQREKHFHALFAEHKSNIVGRTEWFEADYVIRWLREAEWLGNAGNLSQIAAVIDLDKVPVVGDPLTPSACAAGGNGPHRCSQDVDNCLGYSYRYATAPEARKLTVEC